VDCIIVAIRNQGIAYILLGVWTAMIHSLTPFPSAYRIEPDTPTKGGFLRGVVGSLLLREVVAYYIHRLLYHPLLYARIHSQHHRFTAPVALAAHYAHPIEHVLQNLAPIAVYCQLLRCNILTFWFAMSIEITSGLLRHNGYV
jgi:sterol desaturase/sphingolipid hydroxylase (fatty acid hydroxylase superfamily)